MTITKRLASVFGLFGTRRKNWKFADVIQNLSLSLSLRIFVFFSSVLFEGVMGVF